MFFHYHLNLFICCKTKLKKIKLLQYEFVLQNELFDIVKYFKYFYLKKKKFTEKNKVFVKIVHIFFLKIYIFFSNSFATFEQPYSNIRF